MSKRTELVSILTELSELESAHFKSLAYSKASRTLLNMTDSEFNELDDYINLPGVGTSINNKIHEYLETGKVDKLVDLRESAKEFLDQNLYKVRKSFITKRIDIDVPENGIFKILNDLSILFEHVNFDVVGSVRRKKRYIADIDILVWNKEDYSLAYKLLSPKYRVISGGDTKFSLLVDNAEKTTIDVNLGDDRYRPFELLHHTGSAQHNIKLRSIAKSLGYSLSQHGFTAIPGTDQINKNKILRNLCFVTERDIFDFLGVTYVEPEDR